MRRPAVAAAMAGLLSLFVVLSVTPLTNNDVWLQMATGRWILDSGEVPLTDPFSFSAAGNRFHAHEWLAGVVFHLVHSVAGVNGLIFLKTFLGAAALALCMAAARQIGAGWTATLASGGLALAVVNSRFLERPEMFSYMFTALYLLVLAREHEHLACATQAPGRTFLLQPRRLLGTSRLWWLVPLQWLWVQMHGYFLTGLAMVGAFVAAETVARLLPPWPRPWPTTRLTSGAAAVAAMFAVGLVNPNGVEIYTFPFRLAGGNNIFMQTIFEWKPTFTTSGIVGSSMFLAFCLWLGLWAATAWVGPGLRGRIWMWRGFGVAGLAAIVAIGLGVDAGAWQRPPLDLLAGLTGMGPAAGALGSVGGVATLTWLAAGLAVWLGLRFGRPAAPAIGIVAVAIALALQHAGRHAPAVLLATLIPALLVATGRRALPTWQLAITALFLALALRQNRNMVNFALVTLPFLAAGLTRARTALSPRPGQPGVQARGLAALGIIFAGLAAATLSFGWPYTPVVLKHPGLGLGERIPAGAVAYARANGLSGNVYNKYSYGAYLIHELFPATRVYMDSRNGVYGAGLYVEYLNTLRSAETARRVFTQRRFDWVAVDYRLHPRKPDAPGLEAFLAGREGWALVYFDDTSVVYVPDRPAWRDLIARDAYHVIDPAAYRPGVAARLPPAGRRLYAQEAASALDRQPGSIAARLMRADALVALGDTAGALDLYEEVLERRPRRFFTLVSAARLAATLGRLEPARAYYRRALLLVPGEAQILRELADLERRTG